MWQSIMLRIRSGFGHVRQKVKSRYASTIKTWSPAHKVLALTIFAYTTYIWTKNIIVWAHRGYFHILFSFMALGVIFERYFAVFIFIWIGTAATLPFYRGLKMLIQGVSPDSVSKDNKNNSTKKKARAKISSEAEDSLAATEAHRQALRKKHSADPLAAVMEEAESLGTVPVLYASTEHEASLADQAM